MIVTFAYLLCPIIPPNISKRLLERIMIFKVAKLLANIVLNYPFAAKQNFFFWYLTAVIVYLLYCIILQHFKKIFGDQIIRQSCIILAQIGPKLPFLPKENFLEKLTNISLALYIPSCYIILKKLSESRSWE